MRSGQRSRPGRLAAPLRCALAIGMLAALVACGGDLAPHQPADLRTVDAPTLVVSVREIPVIYSTTGSVVSDERVEISSRIAAYVRSIDVREGERVQLNQLLATLDSQDLDAAIRAATAQRDQAAAMKRDADRDAEDSNKLFARGLVAEAHQRKARLAQQGAGEMLAAAEATLTRAAAERQYTRILSPVAGVVVSRHQRAGDLASPGAPLLTVESDTALLFETQVAEQRVGGIGIGDAVKIRIDALGSVLDGEVLRRVSSGNPVTRGFQVKVSLPPTPGLLPGMFGRAEFIVGQQQAVLIPARAMTDRGGLSGIYVVDAEQGLRFRWLRTGRAFDEGIVVLAGLDAGERIVTAPTAKMREGDRLTAKGAP